MVRRDKQSAAAYASKRVRTMRRKSAVRQQFVVANAWVASRSKRSASGRGLRLLQSLHHLSNPLADFLVIDLPPGPECRQKQRVVGRFDLVEEQPDHVAILVLQEAHVGNLIRLKRLPDRC